MGECGLDFYRDYAPRADQVRVFAAQIELANELGAAARRSTPARPTTTPSGCSRRRVCRWCCTASARSIASTRRIARGYHCSFAGNVAYPSAGTLRAAAARVPDDRILAETDSPYLAPPPHRGRPNQPAYVAVRSAVLARERGVEPRRRSPPRSTRNADRLFGL